jgi:hypothetical protein
LNNKDLAGGVLILLTLNLYKDYFDTPRLDKADDKAQGRVKFCKVSSRKAINLFFFCVDHGSIII